jgi:hypothetical protein
VFDQFAGILPDFNRNGIDDLVDIRTTKERDDNKNGIIDSAEGGRPERPTKWMWWWRFLVMLLVVMSLIWLLRKRRRRA